MNLNHPKIISIIAKTCHEANRAYCQSLGDMSQPEWENAPDWQRESAISGVYFHLNNPDAGPEGSHNSWLQEKLDTGWVYGEIKDPEAKTHPCIVPFDQLPREQQAKDYIFRSIVHSMKYLLEEEYYYYAVRDLGCSEDMVTLNHPMTG